MAHIAETPLKIHMPLLPLFSGADRQRVTPPPLRLMEGYRLDRWSTVTPIWKAVRNG